MRTIVIVTMPMTLHGVFVSVAILVIAAIVVSLIILTVRKRSKIVTRSDLLLKANNGCLPNLI